MVVVGPRCHIWDEFSGLKPTRPEGHWWRIHGHQLCRQIDELIEKMEIWVDSGPICQKSEV